MTACGRRVAVWELPGPYGWSAPAVDMDVDEDEARQRIRKELTDVLGSVSRHVAQHASCPVVIARAGNR
ncbi:hypothetical protein [Streptomyces sp. NPDC002671]